jgi:hypothetical protein
MKDDISHLQLKLSESLQSSKNSTKIKVYSDTHHSRFSHRLSIDYNPTGVEDTEDFSEHFCDELQLQSQDVTGTLEEMQKPLKES